MKQTPFFYAFFFTFP
ncbi:pheA operon leader peptide PheL [Enterobacter cloacae complex sp. CDL006]|nr:MULTISPECIES: pheA operon leader peptide PheL [Enterobacter]EHE7801733.1 hypothetical protein [Enterobacter hormaechei]EIY1158608.1 pheA operon leader peptide PheL [Enterobacter hormaechei]EKG3234915.1 pheA operon leader peptide PheL [Enterobacter hormaechei]EKL0728670.1 pheA operon leader peptide PheL [Enterobacter hormaechei]EKS6501702.1 pheA operon leader peptide PheL [Enterobacter hormaechei]